MGWASALCSSVSHSLIRPESSVSCHLCVARFQTRVPSPSLQRSSRPVSPRVDQMLPLRCPALHLPLIVPQGHLALTQNAALPTPISPRLSCCKQCQTHFPSSAPQTSKSPPTSPSSSSSYPSAPPWELCVLLFFSLVVLLDQPFLVILVQASAGDQASSQVPALAHRR